MPSLPLSLAAPMVPVCRWALFLTDMVRLALSGAKAGGGFADIQLKPQRPLFIEEPVKINAGVGIRGGGQDGIMRVEIGPSIQAILPTGGAQFRLDASWRFQIAGNLRPDDGPAITLSTSF